ncbi:hypothetical protein [Aurantiacibacter poecillastricola]|nr:hypothetical protein [Aurantiacibacter sp. 219JJ12-13]MDP5263238.1 hypothetical protein [Aurantiacibacter sp. 219JJ12-13]
MMPIAKPSASPEMLKKEPERFREGSISFIRSDNGAVDLFSVTMELR